MADEMMSSENSSSNASNLRSRRWFNDASNPRMTATYIERYMNYGITREELQSNRPIIGIAQTGSDLTPCNRHHLELAKRVHDGIRDAGGIPLEFPVHPIQETGRRPTGALDRNLAYLGLVEILHGYPIDGVVLTTGCDKTTPACLMAAGTVNIPAIVLSGGPMLDGWWNGQLAGSGTVVWQARKEHSAGRIDYDEFMDIVSSSAPSVGHCNTMGTALSMNCLAEAIGMTLPGGASIPAPYRERGWNAYETGRRCVELVRENLRPSDIMTMEAFDNAVVVAAALGGSSNCPIHMIAIARHMGVDHTLADWQRLGPAIPMLVNCQPAGRYLGEAFHRAGGVQAVLKELERHGKLNVNVRTVTGKTLKEDLKEFKGEVNREVIRSFEKPLKTAAGFVVLTGNIFDSAVIKTSVIDDEFQRSFLSDPEDADAFECRIVVFEGPEDYHDRIDDPSLQIDHRCMLVIRNCGPIAYPGSAEVVNMIPPSSLIQQGITVLPTMGDGRQSGTSGSPSILNISPESAAGGNIALLKTGDIVRIDLRKRRADVLVSDEELAERRRNYQPVPLDNQTPWQEIYRGLVGSLATGGCLELEGRYLNVIETRGEARHSH